MAERYGSNAKNSVPRSIKSPLQSGQREMLDTEIRRELESAPWPEERAGVDAKDLGVPIILPEELGNRVEIELVRDERNPYLQGMAPPSTVYLCVFCDPPRLTAREGLGHGDIADPHNHTFTIED